MNRKNITTQDWMEDSKPWVGMDLPCNDIDCLLFNSSTTINLGDGAKARFWHNNWLEGQAPRYLAPNLFQLARRKNRSVQQELRNNNWILSLRGHIASATHIEEFISLWIRIQDVQLIQGVPDTITWNWTLDDTYSTRSAYRIQFKGSFARFRRDQIWKAHAENKCKVFTWILIHEKLLTADNLQKRDWPHQDHCALCNGPLETGLHLCLCCPFAKAVWNQILTWEHFDGILGQQQAEPLSIIPWWEEATTKVP